ncbi:hypothetical protein GCM10009687_15530 [Asanoa iriomotensis]|uniref:Uncharacterized protein n=1 Tax=Asanoa iriomotensis TaxID=234613 RepID=A0ABQ4C0H0_9ACTN|nr:hypothetical protein Air01nite_23450 [Asanoa iriomotensis]
MANGSRLPASRLLAARVGGHDAPTGGHRTTDLATHVTVLRTLVSAAAVRGLPSKSSIGGGPIAFPIATLVESGWVVPVAFVVAISPRAASDGG